jgi:hypothetical protein
VRCAANTSVYSIEKEQEAGERAGRPGRLNLAPFVGGLHVARGLGAGLGCGRRATPRRRATGQEACKGGDAERRGGSSLQEASRW